MNISNNINGSNFATSVNAIHNQNSSIKSEPQIIEQNNKLSGDNFNITKKTNNGIPTSINLNESQQANKIVTVKDLEIINKTVNELSKAVVQLSAAALLTIDSIDPQNTKHAMDNVKEASEHIEKGKKGVSEQKFLLGLVEEFSNKNQGTDIGNTAKKLSVEMESVIDKSVKDINVAITTLNMTVNYLNKKQ
jgi:hypothetical protein